MRNFLAFCFGLIFSVGLIISGMVNPKKVIGFLDVFHNWDYSLMFVMAGAVVVNLIAFPFILRGRPKFSEVFHLPSNKDIDRRLIVGAALFGIGWGIGGICPGPGIVNLSRGDIESLIFVLSMIVGMYIFSLINLKKNL